MLKHHAFLCRTDKVEPKSVYALIKELQASDVRFVDKEVIGIDDSRLIIEYANVRPNSGDHQLIVVCTKSIRVEAQQALLKVLEEPPISTKFIVCVPTGAHLLPTLLSRFSEYSPEVKVNDTEPNIEFENFCKLTHGERLLEIGKRLDDRDTVWVEKMRDGLAVALTDQMSSFKKDVLRSLNLVVENLNQRGASNKILLEEMALSLPITR